MKEINAIDRINKVYGANLSVSEKDNIYSLFDENTLVVEGDFEKVCGYVHGIEYGLSKKNNSSESVVNYFKQKVNGSISAVVQKRARDTYFSQEIRHFKIKILGVDGNIITYQADSYNTVPSGMAMGGTNYSSPIMNFEIPVNVSMKDLKEKVLDKMLLDLDEEIKNTLLKRRRNKMISHINTDMIINLTEQDLLRFSYTNEKLVTVNFQSEYSL